MADQYTKIDFTCFVRLTTCALYEKNSQAPKIILQSEDGLKSEVFYIYPDAKLISADFLLAMTLDKMGIKKPEELMPEQAIKIAAEKGSYEFFLDIPALFPENYIEFRLVGQTISLAKAMFGIEGRISQTKQ